MKRRTKSETSLDRETYDNPSRRYCLRSRRSYRTARNALFSRRLHTHVAEDLEIRTVVD